MPRNIQLKMKRQNIKKYNLKVPNLGLSFSRTYVGGDVI